MEQTLRLCCAMICITVVLAVNADNFDETEYRAIAWLAGLGVGGESLFTIIKGKLHDRSSTDD